MPLIIRVAAVRKSQERSGFWSPKSGKMVNVQKVRKIEHGVRKSQDFAIKLGKCKN